MDIDTTAAQGALTYVGGRTYGLAFRERARSRVAEIQRAAQTTGVQRSREGDDEVSEEIVVYGEVDEGGGGTDVISIMAWTFHIEVHIPKLPPDLPLPPTGGNDTPPEPEPEPEDPCAEMQMALDDLDVSLAADQTAVEVLTEMIKAAGDVATKRELRSERAAVRKSMKHTENLKKEIEQQMEEMDC